MKIAWKKLSEKVRGWAGEGAGIGLVFGSGELLVRVRV